MKRCKSDEIADALRSELEGGRYRAGMALPSVAELRKRFGAGEFAVRAALKKLRDDGCIVLKTGIGAVVAQVASRDWKGRIAFIATNTSGSYFYHALFIRLSLVFRQNGWDFVPIYVNRWRDDELDFLHLRRSATNGLDFAILITDEVRVAEVCDEIALPYIVLNGYIREFPNAKAVVREDFKKCFSDLISALRYRQVRRVLEVDTKRSMDRSFKNMLYGAGFSVQRMMCTLDGEIPNSLEDVKRSGYLGVAKFLADAKNRKRLPDAIIFDDDYLAVGGITALLECGLRIPQDVRVVTYSNTGNAPIIGVSLARIENDPISYGDVVAKYVLNLLTGSHPSPPRVRWRFIPGDSL